MANTYVRYPSSGGGSGGVTSLNSLTGALTLSAGTNITLTPVGNNIEISATGGSAPTGDANTSAYFDNTGALASNVFSTFNETINSRSDVLNQGGAVINPTGNGSYIHGASQGTMTASGAGSTVAGEVDGGGTLMVAAGIGSMVMGQAASNSIMAANLEGSFAHGFSESGGILAAGGTGATGSGHADANSTISAGFTGSQAFGFATNAFSIVSNANGAMAGGVTTTGDVVAGGVSSFALGDDLDVTSSFGIGFGLGHTNSSYAAMVIGRYGDATGTTGSWVSTEPAFLIGNGANAGALATAFKVDKDGKVTETAALVTAARVVTSSVVVSARTDRKLVLNDIAAGANTITLPPGEEGLTYTLSPAATNTGTWAFIPDGVEVMDADVPVDPGSVAGPKDITFIGGTWYYI